MNSLQLLLLLIVLGCLAPPSSGHGRLMEPPSRSSMWRLGYNTPPNYDDNQLFCGGFNYQWFMMDGKCGICGDPWMGERQNEAGGKYATGIITRAYTQGQIIEVQVEITAHHRGWFEFKLCPNNDVTKPATQMCLDEHVLRLANGDGSSHETRYVLPDGSGAGWFTVPLELPDDVTCEQCVLQWRYHTGNSWDCEPDGSCCTGCGPRQEEFYGCADVKINPGSPQPTSPTVSHIATTSSSAGGQSEPATTRTVSHTVTTSSSAGGQPEPATTATVSHTVTTSSSAGGQPDPATTAPAAPSTVSKVPSTKTPAPPQAAGECHAVGVWKNGAGMKSWCVTNCQRGYCPSSHCKCDAAKTEPTPESTTKIPSPTTHSSDVDVSSENNTPTTVSHIVTTSNSAGGQPEPATVSNFPSTNTPAPPHTAGGCQAVGVWKNMAGMKSWCVTNCQRGYCPPSHCKCDPAKTASPTESTTKILSVTTPSGHVDVSSENNTSLEPSSSEESSAENPRESSVNSSMEYSSGGASSDVTSGSLEYDSGEAESNTTDAEMFTDSPGGDAGSTAPPSVDQSTGYSSEQCAAKGIWRNVRGIRQWCMDNCAAGFCPEFMCRASCGPTVLYPTTSDIDDTTTQNSGSSNSGTSARSSAGYTVTDGYQDFTDAEGGIALDSTPDDVTHVIISSDVTTSVSHLLDCPSGRYSHADGEAPFLDFYCQTVCTIGDCPQSCACAESAEALPCVAAPEYEHLPHMDTFCAGLCSAGVCPPQCICAQNFEQEF